MDIDVASVAVGTLEKNGYKILEDPSFLRTLKIYGISDIKLADKAKAKQTETTQRFKLRLVNAAGEEFPTKVEFSRRDMPDPKDYKLEIINPKIASQFMQLSFACHHYNSTSASIQKLQALSGRTETQARDVFDLYLLYLGGNFSKEIIQKTISKNEKDKCLMALGNLDFESYQGQVVEYLELEFLSKNIFFTTRSYALFLNMEMASASRKLKS